MAAFPVFALQLHNIYEDIISKTQKAVVILMSELYTITHSYCTNFQDFVGCEPVYTGTVGEYELNLFFTKLLADVDVGDQINVILTATVSC